MVGNNYKKCFKTHCHSEGIFWKYYIYIRLEKVKICKITDARRKKGEIDFKALCIFCTLKNVIYSDTKKKQRTRKQEYFNFTFEKYARKLPTQRVRNWKSQTKCSALILCATLGKKVTRYIRQWHS